MAARVRELETAMRTVIFDLDGTLADTAPDLVGAMNMLLAENGAPEAPFAEARAIAGRGGKALISFGFERAGRGVSREDVDRLFPRYLALYGARIDAETRLFDGALAALERLSASGARLGVCTNKPERLALELLERLDVLRFFSAVLGADTLPVRKPDPRHLFETIARAGGAPERSVLIGDSQTDRDAARNAERPIILTSFGYALQPVASLRPDAIIDHYDGLDAALDRVLG
ncbi:MAG: HAD-IA family hydrolase [Pseudomonadota bacterium]